MTNIKILNLFSVLTEIQGESKKGHQTLNLNSSATVYPTEMVQYLKQTYGCQL